MLEVLRNDANRPVCMILMFLLSTGARLNEALQARWDQVEIEQGVWLIPATNSKIEAHQVSATQRQCSVCAGGSRNPQQ
ncbi:MAG: tyrosine-type recombinase/integrase [Comamonadaceae bacterium]|nr:tyrosine-type recombinase/integrase [Comamonadaceae bacterium]